MNIDTAGLGTVLSGDILLSDYIITTSPPQYDRVISVAHTIAASEQSKEGPKGSRFSGADWADQIKEIIVVGVGGIGSWLVMNLSRIGHHVYLFDDDIVDDTNVNGGQMYTSKGVGKYKVNEIVRVCREFGATNSFYPLTNKYTEDSGVFPIMMSGLDNMAGRKLVYQEWKNEIAEGHTPPEDFLLVDGRLLMESCEIFTLKGNDKVGMERYEKEHLFDDSEVADLDCTTKQSTFGAMLIAALMTGILCNFLTNRKLGEDFREVPFYQRFHLPIMNYKKEEV